MTVLDDAQVRDVVTGPDGLLATARPGTVVAVHSTISDTTAVELAAKCAEKGVDFVDAPVSGGAGGAKNGTLAVMVGATDDGFAKIEEPFGTFASLVVHAGPVGAGTRMKLARNLLHFIAFTAATEAQRLAETAGIDITELGKVVRHTDAITGGAGSIMWRNTTSPLTEDDSWFPIFSRVRALGEKDLALALDLGDRSESTCRSDPGRCPTSAPASESARERSHGPVPGRSTHDRRDPPPRPGDDVQGLRLGDAGRSR